MERQSSFRMAGEGFKVLTGEWFQFRPVAADSKEPMAEWLQYLQEDAGCRVVTGEWWRFEQVLVVCKEAMAGW